MGISGVSRCHVEPAQETALLLSSSSPFACLKGEAWVVLGSLATHLQHTHNARVIYRTHSFVIHGVTTV
jgi:hypothetical protein